MKVYVVVDQATDEPNNFGVSVHLSKETAEALAAKLEAEEAESIEAGNYVVEIVESEVQP